MGVAAQLTRHRDVSEENRYRRRTRYTYTQGLQLVITKAWKFMTSRRPKYDLKKVIYNKKSTIYSRDKSKSFGKVLENDQLFSQ